MDAHSEPTQPKTPELIQIPAGAGSKLCECGARIWWVVHNGKRVPVSCPTTLQTKTMGVLAIASRQPTRDGPGHGINHYIDCAKRAKFGRAASASPSTTLESAIGPRPVHEDAAAVAARIRAAEALSQQYDVRCTGAPHVPELCGGFAVTSFVIDGRLVSAPCAAHADIVARALMTERPGAVKAHPLHEWLADRGDVVAQRFAARCTLIRDWNHAGGFKIPAKNTQ